MDLTYWIAASPMWLAVLVIVIVPTLITMCGPIVVRRFVSMERIVGNNEVAGFKFATLGVIYAVLLGLVVISVWEKYAEADDAVTRETGALASLYRLTDGLPGANQQAVRSALAEYADSVAEDDWPAMAKGEESPATRRALGVVYGQILAVPVESARDAVVLDALLTQADLVTDARRERISLAEGVVPAAIWLVLFLGAALTLGFTFFFGVENLRAQVVMAGMLALVIFLALFVAVSISHPFSGPLSVRPVPIVHLIDTLDPGPE
jgi:hypothetical protein